MRFSHVLLGAAAAAGVLASPTPNDYVVHERRAVLPRSWTEEERLDKASVLPMRIGLTQSNLDRGHDLLMEVSDPRSSRYGQHLSVEEVHDLFAPSQETVDNVRAWLESEGISAGRISQSSNKQFLQFDASAAEVESLLGTEYYLYTHQGTGKSHIACREYHVSQSVQRHIDYITPGIKLLEVEGVKRTRSIEKRSLGSPLPPILEGLPLTLPLSELLGNTLAICDVAVTAHCISNLYNLTGGTKATRGNELGIFEDLGDVYSQEDLDLFFSTFAQQIPQGTHPILKAVDGAQAPTSVSNAGPESDLDFQISYPIIWPQKSILFQTDDPNYEANYNF